MAFTSHRLYFQNGLPSVKDVKQKFQEITGLKLQFYATAHLRELITDTGDMLYKLRNVYEETGGNVINFPYFTSPGFDKVYWEDYHSNWERTFCLDFGGGKESFYFFQALVKTMLECGGRTYPHYFELDEEESDAYILPRLEPYHPHERRWKRIRKWDEMSDFEKQSIEPNI